MHISFTVKSKQAKQASFLPLSCPSSCKKKKLFSLLLLPFFTLSHQVQVTHTYTEQIQVTQACSISSILGTRSEFQVKLFFSTIYYVRRVLAMCSSSPMQHVDNSDVLKLCTTWWQYILYISSLLVYLMYVMQVCGVLKQEIQF